MTVNRLKQVQNINLLFGGGSSLVLQKPTPEIQRENVDRIFDLLID